MLDGAVDSALPQPGQNLCPESSVQPQGAIILAANRRIGAKLRRFMAVRTFASVLTGLVVWIFARFVGLELAAAWGAIAFALNYIPFIGPFIATAFPTLFAIAQFDTWQSAIFVFVALVTLHGDLERGTLALFLGALTFPSLQLFDDVGVEHGGPGN